MAIENSKMSALPARTLFSGTEIMEVVLPGTANYRATLDDLKRYFGRTELTEQATIYVNPAGNGGNGTVGDPFDSLQTAVTYLSRDINLGGSPQFGLDIQLADGQYDEWAFCGRLDGLWGALSPQVRIVGNDADPSAVVVHPLTLLCGVNIYERGWGLRSFTIDTTALGGGASAICCGANAWLEMYNMRFKLGANQTGIAQYGGGYVQATGPMAVEAAALRSLYYGENSSRARLELDTLTLVGACAIDDAFIKNQDLSTVRYWHAAVVGSATGKRYSTDTDSQIYTWGEPADFIPGSTAGTATNGSSYR